VKTIRGRSDAIACLLYGGKDAWNVFQEKSPRTGQLSAAGGANKQACSYFLFQLLDGAGQGRLIDMQPFCSTGEVELLSNRQKVTKVT